MSNSIDSPDYPDPMMVQPGPTSDVAKVYLLTITLCVVGLMAPWYVATAILVGLGFIWHEIKDAL